MIVVVWHLQALLIIVSDMTISCVCDVPGASTFVAFGALIPGAIVEVSSFIGVMGFVVDPPRKDAVGIVAVVIVGAVVAIIVRSIVAVIF